MSLPRLNTVQRLVRPLASPWVAVLCDVYTTSYMGHHAGTQAFPLVGLPISLRFVVEPLYLLTSNRLAKMC
jgi:hypothetical protein